MTRTSEAGPHRGIVRYFDELLGCRLTPVSDALRSEKLETMRRDLDLSADALLEELPAAEADEPEQPPVDPRLEPRDPFEGFSPVGYDDGLEELPGAEADDGLEELRPEEADDDLEELPGAESEEE